MGTRPATCREISGQCFDALAENQCERWRSVRVFLDPCLCHHPSCNASVVAITTNWITSCHSRAAREVLLGRARGTSARAQVDRVGTSPCAPSAVIDDALRANAGVEAHRESTNHGGSSVPECVCHVMLGSLWFPSNYDASSITRANYEYSAVSLLEGHHKPTPHPRHRLPIPSHPIPSHPIPSHPIPSHPFHSIPFHPPPSLLPQPTSPSLPLSPLPPPPHSSCPTLPLSIPLPFSLLPPLSPPPNPSSLLSLSLPPLAEDRCSPKHCI